MVKMPEIDINCDLVDQEQHLADTVIKSTTNVDTNHNNSQLEFLEVYYIKNR